MVKDIWLMVVFIGLFSYFLFYSFRSVDTGAVASYAPTFLKTAAGAFHHLFGQAPASARHWRRRGRVSDALEQRHARTAVLLLFRCSARSGPSA